jgi:hypothetical protein
MSVVGFITLVAYIVARPNIPTFIGGAFGLAIAQLLAYYLYKGSPVARAFVLLNAIAGTAFLPFTLQKADSWLKVVSVVQLLPYLYAAFFLIKNWPLTREYFARRKSWHKAVEILFVAIGVLSLIGVVVGLIYQPRFIAEKQAYKDQIQGQLVLAGELPAGVTDNCMTRYKFKMPDPTEREGFCRCFVKNIATYSKDIDGQGIWKLLVFSGAYEEVCRENASAFSLVK